VTEEGPPIVVVIGSINVDLVAYMALVPEPGETVIGGRSSVSIGGKGANQAVMAARLGAEVWLLARVGDDPNGEMALTGLASEGIGTGQVERVAGPSGTAQIWVDRAGTNRIVVIPGANATFLPDEAAISIAAIPMLAVAVGQLEIPQAATEAAFRAAHVRGAVTILNPAPALAITPGLLEATDWLIPNEVEFESLAGATGGPSDAWSDAALAAFATMAGTRLVVTLGAGGAALVSANGEVIRVPAEPVTAIDTTGAGDAFVGAFAYAIAAGLSEPVALTLGVLCGSESVTRLGAQGSFPDRSSARTLLAEVRQVS
jgi:ribokinase